MSQVSLRIRTRGILFSLIFLLTCGARAYPYDMETAKVYFLRGEYGQCIKECEKIIAQKGTDAASDEAYYFLGLSYLKEGNYLRATDIFEIILNEFPKSRLRPEAKLGLGDAQFLNGEYEKAEASFRPLLEDKAAESLWPAVRQRLADVALKKGNITAAAASMPGTELYYSVQVGCFSKSLNASNLVAKLVAKGYPAFQEEIKGEDAGRLYRVKVGKLSSRAEAVQLSEKLASQGYPVRITP